jgi:hypothetical protein
MIHMRRSRSVVLADKRRDGAERVGPLGRSPTADPHRSHPFLFVVLGVVGQRMALSQQPKDFIPALHDVRPEPVAALGEVGAEYGRAIAGDRAREAHTDAPLEMGRS